MQARYPGGVFRFVACGRNPCVFVAEVFELVFQLVVFVSIIFSSRIERLLLLLELFYLFFNELNVSFPLSEYSLCFLGFKPYITSRCGNLVKTIGCFDFFHLMLESVDALVKRFFFRLER